jgi:hypothetical protein
MQAMSIVFPSTAAAGVSSRSGFRGLRLTADGSALQKLPGQHSSKAVGKGAVR